MNTNAPWIAATVAALTAPALGQVTRLDTPLRVSTTSGCGQATPEQLALARQRLDQRRAQLHPADSVTVGVNRERMTGLDIQYTLTPAAAANTAFVAALEAAAQVWESRISTPAVVRYEVDLADLGPGVLLATNRAVLSGAASQLDPLYQTTAQPQTATLVAAVPQNAFFIHDDPLLGPPIVSVNDDIQWIDTYGVFKGWGAVPFDDNTYGSDATLTISSAMPLDHDPSDGVAPGVFSTVDVMVHELGHALGFDSGVSSEGAYAYTLDRYRLGVDGAANDPDTLAEFSTANRELREGVEASIDTVGQVANAPTLLSFSTGDGFDGDGYAAGHWKVSGALPAGRSIIGIMDPLAGYGFTLHDSGYVSEADRLAIALIGWDIDVAFPDPPAGEVCATAPPIADGTTPWVMTGYSAEFGPEVCTGTQTPDRWYAYTASRTGTTALQVTDLNSAFGQASIEVYASGDCPPDPFSIATCGFTLDDLGGGAWSLSTQFPTVAGAPYLIRLSAGTETQYGDITITPPPPPGESCADAEPIGDGTTPWSMQDYAPNPIEPNPSCQTQSFPDRWYLYTASQTGPVAVELRDPVSGSAFSVGMAVWNSAVCPPTAADVFFCEATATPDAGDYVGTGQFDAVAGAGYLVRINASSDVLSGTITFTPIDDCVPDVNTTNTNPGDAGYGQPDGTVDGADLSYYVENWLGQNAPVADVNTTNTNPGDPAYGQPDGTVDGADLSYYVEAWLAGCS